MTPFGGRGRGDFCELHFPEKLFQLQWKVFSFPWEAGQGVLPWLHLKVHIWQLEWDIALDKFNMNNVSENSQTFICGLKLKESICSRAAS